MSQKSKLHLFFYKYLLLVNLLYMIF